MAIIVVTGSAGSRRDATASALTNDPALDEEKDSGCDPCDLWMLSPSAASVLYGHLPISSIQVGRKPYPPHPHYQGPHLYAFIAFILLVGQFFF